MCSTSLGQFAGHEAARMGGREIINNFTRELHAVLVFKFSMHWSFLFVAGCYCGCTGALCSAVVWLPLLVLVRFACLLAACLCV